MAALRQMSVCVDLWAGAGAGRAGEQLPQKEGRSRRLGTGLFQTALLEAQVSGLGRGEEWKIL